ncbi:MAG: hypothetical protein WC292_01570 [Clostridia bacterium]
MMESRQSSKFRTVNALAKEIKAGDPDTCICASFIRELVREDRITYRMSRTRVYVNVDSFWAYMQGKGINSSSGALASASVRLAGGTGLPDPLSLQRFG